MTPHRPRTSRPRDAGISTLEMLGVVTVAALLVAGSFVVARLYPDEINLAFCRLEAIVTGGSADSCASGTGPTEQALTDADLQPKVCMLNQVSTKDSGGVTIGFVDFGADWALKTETYSDDKVKVTVVNGAHGGVTAGAGGDVAGMTGKVEASAGLDLSYGDTWVYTQKEWEVAEQELRDYMGWQSRFRWAGAGSWWGARAPKPPDLSQTTVGVDVGVKGELSARAPVENATDYSLGLGGVSAQAGAGRDLVVETDNATGMRTTTYQGEISGSAQGNVLGLGGSIGGAKKAAVKITEDENGKLVKVRFQTTSEQSSSGAFNQSLKYTEPKGPGSLPGSPTNSATVKGGQTANTTEVVVTTTELTVDDSNRHIVQQWLDDRHVSLGGGLPFDEVIPSQRSDDALGQLLYEQGVTSRTVYADESTKTSVGASFAWGGKFGVDYSTTDSTRELTDAQFLGAPGQDGVRPFIPNDMCLD